MLTLAFVLLLSTALLGGVLAARHLRTEYAPPGPVFGALHGLVGIAGFTALLLSLRGPPRGETMVAATVRWLERLRRLFAV